MHEDDRGRAELERPLDDLARIDRRVIDSPTLMHFIGEQVYSCGQ